MTSRRICLICGATDDEVLHMHAFPKNLERSKIWQENMGIKYAGDSLRNYRICSRHFSPECYIGSKLHRQAVPTRFPGINPSTEQVCLLESDLDIIGHGEGGVGVTSHLDVAGPSTLPAIQPERILTLTPSTSSAVQPKERHTHKSRLFKGIPNISLADSTPRKQHLMNVILKKEDHVRKLKNLCKQRANDIRALSSLSESPIVRQLFSSMSTVTADFLTSQMRCAVQNPKARRWTIEDKVVALAIFKRSPKCYNFMRKLLALPSRRTLLELLKKVPFAAGINHHLFQHINQTLTNPEDRMCVLMFDEMDIKEHVFYDAAKDRIIGFEDFGTGQEGSMKVANKALVFMCQGLTRKWKQPVAYYFCNNACSGEKLVQCVTDVLDAAINVAGLDVVATICDMGTNNVKALKAMNSSLERPYIVFGEDERHIYTMFDPPHLLKCTVALFRKYPIELPIQVGGVDVPMQAQFRHVREAHNIDKSSPMHFRAMFKIKEAHLAPVMRFAMKVSIAAQVMSRTVAAFLYSLVSRGELDQQALATATFVSEVDELFDSFNGSQLNPGDKPLKCAISESSPHLGYWERAYDMVKRWSFRRITKTGRRKEGKPPSQLGWMVSIRAIKSIWHYVKCRGVTYLRPRYLNQDSLENLFGAIRGGCGSGDNPTVFQFVGSLKTQILNGLSGGSITGTNCEEDEHSLLSNLRDFLCVAPTQPDNVALELGVAPLPDEQEGEHLTTTLILSDINADPMALHTTGILSVAYVLQSVIMFIVRGSSQFIYIL